MSFELLAFDSHDLQRAEMDPSNVDSGEYDTEDAERNDTALLLPSKDSHEEYDHQKPNDYDTDTEKKDTALLLPSKETKTITLKGKSSPKAYLILLTLIAALGGFLFGYDTGVVSGALLDLRKTFDLSITWQEIIVSVTIAAAAISAAISGLLCDLIGRKWTLILASIVFTIGAIVMGVAVAAWMLMLGRIIVGLGIGAAAMASPMYIAESAPSHIRGKLVVLNNMFITGGQFMATVVDGVFSFLPLTISWRFMLGLAGLPSVLMLVGMLFMPESPRWLVFHGREDKARAVLAKVRPLSQVEAELQFIKDDYDREKKLKLGFFHMVKRLLTTRTVLIALLVGCGLQLFQQFGGINTVMYYSASIFAMAGFSDKNAIWLATIPGFTNFIFTAVGLLLVDRLGRRKLFMLSILGSIVGFGLLTGTFALMNHLSPAATPFDKVNGTCQYWSCGECVGNSMCGFCYDFDFELNQYFNGTCSSVALSADFETLSKYILTGTNSTCAVVGENWTSPVTSEGLFSSPFERDWGVNSCPGNFLAPLAIVALIVYIASFASGAGPLPWTVNAEIYPTWARSTCIAIATAVNWSSNLVISMTFLTMADGLGQPITFSVYAVLSLMGLLFVILLLPETKGKKLEEIEGLFQRLYFLNWCRRQKQKQLN